MFAGLECRWQTVPERKIRDSFALGERYDQDINLETDQLGRQARQALILAFRRSVGDGNVLADDVAKLAEFLLERLNEWTARRIPYKTDSSHPPRLLRLGAERCGKQRDYAGVECTPIHSIT